MVLAAHKSVRVAQCHWHYSLLYRYKQAVLLVAAYGVTAFFIQPSELKPTQVGLAVQAAAAASREGSRAMSSPLWSANATPVKPSYERQAWHDTPASA